MIYTPELIELYERADIRPLWPLDTPGVITCEQGDDASRLIRLQVWCEQGVIQGCRYKVSGCPYTIGLCIWLAEQLDGCALQNVPEWSVAALVSRFRLPESKYGCAATVIRLCEQLRSHA